MNEAETRAEHIDPALKAAGWGAVEGSRVGREYLIAPGRIEGRVWRGEPEKGRAGRRSFSVQLEAAEQAGSSLLLDSCVEKWRTDPFTRFPLR